MSRARTVFAALALTALLACEPVLEPEVSVDVSSPAFAKGPVGQSVTGSGHLILVSGTRRTFAFTARIHADGSVDGQWQRVTHFLDTSRKSRSHGKITCFTIIGNQAWIGGFKTSGTTFVDPPNNEVGWRVVDNGQGRNAPADQISFQFVGRPPGTAASYCTNTPAVPALRDVVAGNIQVRE